MATSAITYGVECWLVELARNGWNLTVSERLQPSRPVTLRLIEDNEFEPMTLLAPAFQVGVLAAHEVEGAGVFIPTANEGEARELLARVEAELDSWRQTLDQGNGLHAVPDPEPTA